MKPQIARFVQETGRKHDKVEHTG